MQLGARLDGQEGLGEPVEVGQHRHAGAAPVLLGRAEPLPHVVGERGGGRVVEDERGGQLDRRRPHQAVAQLDGGERVETQIAERLVGLDRVGLVVAQHDCRLGADQVHQRLGAVRRGHRVERPRPSARARPVPARRAPRPADQVTQERRHVRQLRQVQPRRHQDGSGPGECHSEQVRRLVLAEDQHAAPGPTKAVGGGEVTDHPGARQQPPGQRGGGQTRRRAPGGEPIEEAVGRRVPRLATATERAGRGGAQHERGQVHLPGEFVQVPRGVDLRSEHRVDLVRGEGGQDAVVERAGRVHDGGHGVVVRHGREHGRERVAVGHVARHDLNGGAVRGEVGDQCVDALGGGAAP